MIHYLKPLLSCLHGVALQGYTDNFKILNNVMKSLHAGYIYSPDDVHVLNYFRFEGASNPNDNSILYVIETKDGNKGTLVDCYGISAGAEVGNFMLHVQAINKKQ